MNRDGHHVLFEKRLWEAHQPGKVLRAKPGLLVPMYRDAHEALHREIALVPPLPYRMGQVVLSLYRDNPDDHLKSIDNLLFAAEEATRRAWVSPLERSLAHLAMDSLEMQLPFIRDGS